MWTVRPRCDPSKELMSLEYAGLLGRVCPAAVYEYADADGSEADASGKKFVINSQNCIHCKTCSIKTPTQDITWTVPEGGGGPKYCESRLPTVHGRSNVDDCSHNLIVGHAFTVACSFSSLTRLQARPAPAGRGRLRVTFLPSFHHPSRLSIQRSFLLPLSRCRHTAQRLAGLPTVLLPFFSLPPHYTLTHSPHRRSVPSRPTLAGPDLVLPTQLHQPTSVLLSPLPTPT